MLKLRVDITKKKGKTLVVHWFIRGIPKTSKLRIDTIHIV